MRPHSAQRVRLPSIFSLTVSDSPQWVQVNSISGALTLVSWRHSGQRTFLPMAEGSASSDVPQCPQRKSMMGESLA